MRAEFSCFEGRLLLRIVPMTTQKRSRRFCLLIAELAFLRPYAMKSEVMYIPDDAEDFLRTSPLFFE
eukprot:scaffold69994_cov66-Cyclotella_meneghiniana.AAC.2